MGSGSCERRFHHRDAEHAEIGVFFYEKFYSAPSAPSAPPRCNLRACSTEMPEYPKMKTLSGSILVADDDPDIRDILSETLNSLGSRVITAANGRECLDKLDKEAHWPL